VLLWALLNATLQTGLKNPLDEAIANTQPGQEDLSGFTKIDEIPYDFVRKRLSVAVQQGAREQILITKGAVQNVLDACAFVQGPHGPKSLGPAERQAIEEKFRHWSAQGYRV
ncbi:MAG: magnesium-translocating P-type ATPase, partial [Mesorhizobium sp.]